MSGIIRTVTGDVPADPNPAGSGGGGGSGALGWCDAHEHVILRGRFIAERYPDLLLDDEDAAARDLATFREAGGGWVVDSMPTGPGRDVAALERVSRASGVPIVAATGRHLARYHPDEDPLLDLDRDALAELFVQEIEAGVGGDGPSCGVIKVAGGGGGGGRGSLDDTEREAFHAAADAHRRTGCPILTHTEGDADALEQAELLCDAGADLSRVTLSHCDKNPDPQYHRDLLATGVRLEYDQHFRQLRRGGAAHTVRLIAELLPGFPDQLVVGMDLARRVYWPSYGGGPGPKWLVTELPRLLRDAGLDPPLIDRLYRDNPANAFSFPPVPAVSPAPTA